MTDRRRSWRTEIALECTLHRRTGKVVEAQTLDLGPGGMRVKTSRPLAVDETFEFERLDGIITRLYAGEEREHEQL